jgi:hypothetical protein
VRAGLASSADRGGKCAAVSQAAHRAVLSSGMRRIGFFAAWGVSLLGSGWSCSSGGSRTPTVPGSILEPKGSNTVSAAGADGSGASPDASLLGTPGRDPAAEPEPFPLTATQACVRFAALTASNCDWTKRFPAEFAEPSVCEPSIETWIHPPAPQPSLAKLVNCWALDCDHANNCMILARNAAPPRPARKCGEQGTGPVLVDAATYAKRRGVNAKRFSDIATTVDQPIEVCGIDGEVAWMLAMRCNDGSTPYKSGTVVNTSRDPWFGEGGSCHSVLDRYTVACPEQTYQVHIDRYICPART